MKTMVDMGLVDHTIAGGIISFQPPGIVNGKFRVEFKTWVLGFWVLENTGSLICLT